MNARSSRVVRGRIAGALTALLALAGGPGTADGATTHAFLNPTPINIPGTGTSGPASPFPSTISVSGLASGDRVTRVFVILSPLTHTFPRDVDIVLHAPSGQNIVLMADVGAGAGVAGVPFQFDDCATATLPAGGPLQPGTYRPTNAGDWSGGTVVPTGHTLGTFVGRVASTLNGTWSLYVYDDFAGDAGQLATGWAIFITTVPAPATPVTALSCGPDFDLDGIADIVAGAGVGGGPHVQVRSGATGDSILSFFAYDLGLSSGIRVAACDFNGDRRPDIVTVPGPGGAPHIRVFDGLTGNPLAGVLGTGFFPYDPGFIGGAYIGCADMNADGVPDIIVAPGQGGGPHVRVFDGRTGLPLAGTLGSGIFVYDPGFTGGVFVGP